MKLKRLTVCAIFGVVSALLITSLTACTTKSNPPIDSNNGKPFTVATSFYPMYVLTKNVVQGVDNVELFNMTEPQTGCLHDYQLTVNDVKQLTKADVLVINHPEMESFLGKILDQLPQIQVIEASEGIPVLENGQGHNGETEANLHIWAGISGAMEEVDNIAASLAEIDPTHKTQYLENAKIYNEKLAALRDKTKDAIAGLPSQKIVTFHDGFAYFAQEFGLEVVSVIQNEPGHEPSAKEIQETINIIKEQDVKALFAESQVADKTAKMISEQTGVPLYYLDLVVTGEKEAAADSYEKAMENNVSVLQKALS